MSQRSSECLEVSICASSRKRRRVAVAPTAAPREVHECNGMVIGGHGGGNEGQSLEEVTSRLRATVAELKRKREQLRLQRRRSKWNPADTPLTTRVALALLSLSPGEERPAREYLGSAVGADRCREALSSASLAAWLAAAGDFAVDAVLAPERSWGQRALREAHKFLEERRLRDWVRDANLGKGLAPKGRNLWREYCRRSARHREADPGGGYAGRQEKERARGQWLRRWARRWAVRRGKFKVGDRLSGPDLRKKAALGRAPFFAPEGSRFGLPGLPTAWTILGSKTRPKTATPEDIML